MKQQKVSQDRDDMPVGNPFGPAFSVSLADAVGKGASVFGRGFASMQQEGLRFMNQRFEDNIKAASEVGTCKNLPDLLAVQQKWLANMTRAYADEWHRYNVLMTDLVRGNGIVTPDATMARPSRSHDE
jgi:hypothetical protein